MMKVEIETQNRFIFQPRCAHPTFAFNITIMHRRNVESGIENYFQSKMGSKNEYHNHNDVNEE